MIHDDVGLLCYYIMNNEHHGGCRFLLVSRDVAERRKSKSSLFLQSRVQKNLGCGDECELTNQSRTPTNQNGINVCTLISHSVVDGKIILFSCIP